jgi:hypothetical protein
MPLISSYSDLSRLKLMHETGQTRISYTESGRLRGLIYAPVVTIPSHHVRTMLLIYFINRFPLLLRDHLPWDVQRCNMATGQIGPDAQLSRCAHHANRRHKHAIPQICMENIAKHPWLTDSSLFTCLRAQDRTLMVAYIHSFVRDDWLYGADCAAR